ncbi:hypothetical protein WA577_005370 [Blastocystis sp. JDR]
MATFSIQNKDCVLFDLTAGGDSEDSLTICNTCNYNLIFSIRTNSKTKFTVKPTKFFLKPGNTTVVRFSLKKAYIDELLKQEIPTKDKIEILAMRVSGVFSDVATNAPKDLSDLIRNRFKASEKSQGFKSIDNPGEETMEGNAEMEEITKYRISVIYKSGAEMVDERMDAAAPVTEETQVENPAPMIVSKKAPCKQLALLSLGVAWSICMIAIGYFLCKLNSSP